MITENEMLPADRIRKLMPSGWTPTEVTDAYSAVLEAAAEAAQSDKECIWLLDVLDGTEIAKAIASHRHYHKVDILLSRLRAAGFTVTIVPNNIIIDWN